MLQKYRKVLNNKLLKRDNISTNAQYKNIQWLKSDGYRYIVVSRKKKIELPSDLRMHTVKEDERTNTIFVRAGLSKNDESGEVELYCHSVDKEKKEESIKNNFQKRFEAELLKARKALHLKNGTKRYDKVVERIARNKEKYKRVSHRYVINIEKNLETDKAINITWSCKKDKKASGLYCLRTNREDLNVQQIWDTYTMLTDIEDAFRCMKSELGLRPIYHHKESRCDGHIFITLLAYHVMHTIRFKLRKQGINFTWATIRKQLSSLARVTTTMKQKDGKIIHIRKTVKSEPQHQAIFDALNLTGRPGKMIKVII